MAYCLAEAGLSQDQLVYIVFYEKPLTKFDRLLETYLGYAPRGFASFRLALPVWLKEKLYLRRLLRKAIICRVAGTQRCYLTPYGWRLARFYARLEARVFRPALTAINAPPIESNAPLSKALRTIDAELDRFFAQAFPGRKAA